MALFICRNKQSQDYFPKDSSLKTISRETQKTTAVGKKGLSRSAFHIAVESAWRTNNMKKVQRLMYTQPSYSEHDVTDLFNALKNNDSERFLQLIQNVPFPLDALRKAATALLAAHNSKLLNRMFFSSWVDITEKKNLPSLKTFVMRANCNEEWTLAGCRSAQLDLLIKEAHSSSLSYLTGYLQLLKTKYKTIRLPSIDIGLNAKASEWKPSMGRA